MTVDPRGYEQSRTQTQGIGLRCLGRISYFRSGGICRGCPVDALHEDLELAIDHLLRSGFHRAELSLLASEHTVAKKLGHHYRRAIDAGDDSSLPRAAFVSTAAIGDAEGGLIGALAYVGATVAIGVVVVAGGALADAKLIELTEELVLLLPTLA